MTIQNLLCCASILITSIIGCNFSAHAQILAVETLDGTYTQRVDYGWRAIALRKGPPVQSVQFETMHDNEKVVITYSGTCLALDFTVYARANVDGTVASPGQNAGAVLCSYKLSGSFYPASRIFSTVLAKKGTHNVSIEVRGDQNAGIMIGDSALVVQH